VLLTAPWLTTMRWAMAAFDRASAMSDRTSHSRAASVSLSASSTAAGADELSDDVGIERGPAGCDRGKRVLAAGLRRRWSRTPAEFR
jgi:hypothetical protein